MNVKKDCAKKSTKAKLILVRLLKFRKDTMSKMYAETAVFATVFRSIWKILVLNEILLEKCNNCNDENEFTV